MHRSMKEDNHTLAITFPDYKIEKWLFYTLKSQKPIFESPSIQRPIKKNRYWLETTFSDYKIEKWLFLNSQIL